MYLGALSRESSSAYYLPLLSVMKRRNNPAEQGLIAELEVLPRIEIINKENTCGFPDECNPLFSHGGYTIIYKTLCDGRSCLAIRNLTGSMRDEEGRSAPFNLLFVAESAEDNYSLDKVAIYCKEHSQDIKGVLSPAIVYDVSVNGLRADLQVIYDWMCSLPDTASLIHDTSRVNYMVVSSVQMIDVAVREQNLAGIPIDAIFHDDGSNLQGVLKKDVSRCHDGEDIRRPEVSEESDDCGWHAKPDEDSIPKGNGILSFLAPVIDFLKRRLNDLLSCVINAL